MLYHFSIPFYEQHAQGAVVVQHHTGQIQHFAGPSPMAGARRIDGGIGRLVEAIASQIPAEDMRLGHTAQKLSRTDSGVVVEIQSATGEHHQITAKQVALALPPRLAGDLSWEPSLPSAPASKLQRTPTWMAGHSKFFAVYDRPFWREAGLCGSAMSRRGPLAEIHDASPHSGRSYSLFGFVGIDAATRSQIGRDQLSQLALEQLVQLFGAEAGNPLQIYLQDWSQEPFTASQADQQPQTRHPDYGLKIDWGEDWHGRVSLISSETSFANGGLIEGALEAGIQFAQQVADGNTAAEKSGEPHKASMDWDWLKPK